MPTTSCKTWRGTTVTSATPITATMTARVRAANAAPTSGARHPRVVPTARTIVSASTNSTLDAMKLGVAATASVSGATTGQDAAAPRQASPGYRSERATGG